MNGKAFPVIATAFLLITIAFTLHALFVQFPDEERRARAGDRDAIIAVCNRELTHNGTSIVDCLNEYGLEITEERR